MSVPQVFTLLKETFKLPNFTEEHNWISHLSPNREISDFEYNDSQGVFTRILQDHFGKAEHVIAPRWLNSFPSQELPRWPHYFIEVKSTTEGDHKTPFYVSEGQFQTVSVRGTKAGSTDLTR